MPVCQNDHTLITFTLRTREAVLSAMLVEVLLYGLGLELRLMDLGDSVPLPPFKRPGKLLSRLGRVGRGMLGNNCVCWVKYETDFGCM
jgi:hypothetical protein